MSNDIKIVSANGKRVVKETTDVPGLVRIELEHQIAESNAHIEYNGPKISPAEWHKAMSFCRWSYDTFKSEAQLRCFIDPVANSWLFWAFPQEAGRGMSTKEIDGADMEKQRAELPHADRLIPFGTIHDHCSGSAFQSGVDEHNEKSQDGLHFTFGKVDKDEFDLDSRLYLLDTKYNPLLSAFWDIGPEVAKLIPHKLHGDIALWQMKQFVQVEFPQQWKDNMKVEKRVSVSDGDWHPYRGTSMGIYTGGDWKERKIKETIMEWMEINKDMAFTQEEWNQVLDFLYRDQLVDSLLLKCKEKYADPYEVVAELATHPLQYFNLMEKIACGEPLNESKPESKAGNNGSGTGMEKKKKKKEHPSHGDIKSENGWDWQWDSGKERWVWLRSTPDKTEQTIIGSVPGSTYHHGQHHPIDGSIHWDSDLNTWVDFQGYPVD